MSSKDQGITGFFSSGLQDLFNGMSGSDEGGGHQLETGKAYLGLVIAENGQTVLDLFDGGFLFVLNLLIPLDLVDKPLDVVTSPSKGWARRHGG